MKRFKTTVTRTDEYIIEIDETILNDEWMKHFARYFCEFDSLEEHAEHISQMRARFQQHFIEGYGAVKVNGKIPYCYSKDEIRNPNEAINIIIKSEDRDCEVEVEEIK